VIDDLCQRLHGRVQEAEALELCADALERAERLLSDLLALAHGAVSVLAHQVFLHQGFGFFRRLSKQLAFEARHLLAELLVDLAELIAAGRANAAEMGPERKPPSHVFRGRNVRDQVLPVLVVDSRSPLADTRIEVLVQLARQVIELSLDLQQTAVDQVNLRLGDTDGAQQRQAVHLEQLLGLALVLEERSEVFRVRDLDRAQRGQRLRGEVRQLGVLGQEVLLAETLSARPEVDVQRDADDTGGLRLFDVGNDRCVHVGCSM
jgi:hypothetical protein